MVRKYKILTSILSKIDYITSVTSDVEVRNNLIARSTNVITSFVQTAVIRITNLFLFFSQFDFEIQTVLET